MGLHGLLTVAALPLYFHPELIEEFSSPRCGRYTYVLHDHTPAVLVVFILYNDRVL
jgi:hypothetical protein